MYLFFIKHPKFRKNLVRAGVLFFMVDIFQNRYNEYCSCKYYHEFFVCTHRKRLLPFKARNGGIHTLPAPRLSILYCYGAVISYMHWTCFH